MCSTYVWRLRPGLQGLLPELPTEVGDELRQHEAEEDEVVGLRVAVRDADLCLLVQLLLPPVHAT